MTGVTRSSTSSIAQAVTGADLGACLRRAGRRRAAADRLRGAEATLTQLRAIPYLTRVQRELTASGLRPGHGATAPGAQLTPAEVAVARLVADGKSNREVATQLVLSTKTVERHLGRIYTKLRISSRTQLALRLTER